MSTHVRTILFTDIEGSTRLWEQEGERMASALARHDARARVSVAAHRGTVVKTTGDGFFATFADPLDALNAAVDFQRSLADPAATNGIPIRARCGLHLGTVEERGGDCFGNPVNRAARLMSVAHGGQVLLSQAAVDAVCGRLPPSISLHDLGSVRLKDLAAPERVHQALHPDLRRDFPALRSLEATPNNLPQSLTTFIGREREVMDVGELRASARLVTLAGMGGVGKTRLALQVAAEALEAHPDGVWFVDLAPLSDPSLVPSTVAQVLNVREEAGRSITQTLCAHLRPLATLLILDNCEHAIAACAELAHALLQAAPDLRIIATTREPLHVPGEQIHGVAPLGVPASAADVDALSRSEAVQLFLDRARLQKPEFTLTVSDAPAIVELCTRLEGIPLALELAAARLRVLSVREINRRLDERFDLLTGGGRVLLERQQTLRALFDWSYELLTPAERELLCRLSVFAGSWSLEAAARICASEGVGKDVGEHVEEGPRNVVGNDADEVTTLDLLAALADKSLLTAQERDGSTRYRMLETVRQYARGRLREHDDVARWKRRHLAYFAGLAEQAGPQLTGADQKTWLERLEAEHDNLRTALAWGCAEGHDATSATRMAAALWRFWFVRGHLGEARRALAAVRAATPPGQPPEIAQATSLYAAGALAWRQGDRAEAVALHEQGLALYRRLGDKVGIAASLNGLANIAKDSGDYASARAWYTESLALFREAGDVRGIATLQINLGIVARDQGDLAAARELFEGGLAFARQRGDPRDEASALNNLGGVAYAERNLAAARPLYEASLAISRNLGDKVNVAAVLNHLGVVAGEQGDLAAARACFEESLSLHVGVGDRYGTAVSLEGVAEVAGIAGEGLRAARLWGAAQRLRDEIGCPVLPTDHAAYGRAVAASRSAAADDAAFDAAWQEGRRLGYEQALALALARGAA